MHLYFYLLSNESMNEISIHIYNLDDKNDMDGSSYNALIKIFL